MSNKANRQKTSKRSSNKKTLAKKKAEDINNSMNFDSHIRITALSTGFTPSWVSGAM